MQISEPRPDRAFELVEVADEMHPFYQKQQNARLGVSSVFLSTDADPLLLIEAVLNWMCYACKQNRLVK